MKKIKWMAEKKSDEIEVVPAIAYDAAGELLLCFNGIPVLQITRSGRLSREKITRQEHVLEAGLEGCLDERGRIKLDEE